eukprot:scaffold1307_cov200-Pinguiococcus_pyrenoidosus.AAC.32
MRLERSLKTQILPQLAKLSRASTTLASFARALWKSPTWCSAPGVDCVKTTASPSTTARDSARQRIFQLPRFASEETRGGAQRALCLSEVSRPWATYRYRKTRTTPDSLRTTDQWQNAGNTGVSFQRWTGRCEKN